MAHREENIKLIRNMAYSAGNLVITESCGSVQLNRHFAISEGVLVGVFDFVVSGKVLLRFLAREIGYIQLPEENQINDFTICAESVLEDEDDFNFQQIRWGHKCIQQYIKLMIDNCQTIKEDIKENS